MGAVFLQLRSVILLLVMGLLGWTIGYFERRSMRALSRDERETIRRVKFGLPGFAAFSGPMLGLLVVTQSGPWLPASTMFLASFPLILAGILLANRWLQEGQALAGAPTAWLERSKRLSRITAILYALLFASVIASITASLWDLKAIKQTTAKSQTDQRAEDQRVAARLIEIKAEAAKFAGRPEHEISVRAEKENAKKSDPASYERPIYLKLPLFGVRFHWRFEQKAKLLKGKLELTIFHGPEPQTLVIFENGAFSPDWEIMDSKEKEPDEMYFGFHSKLSYAVSEMDRVEIHLTVPGDVTGTGPDSTGILKQGEYVSFTQFTLYHLPDAKRDNDYAFLNNDGWNVLWKMEITSEQGWMSVN